ANSLDAREEIEKALQKLNKTESVKQVYRQILNAIDKEEIDAKEDIFVIKRHFFTQAQDQLIQDFSKEWFVSPGELRSSVVQYMIGMESIPNLKGIIESKDYEAYKNLHPEVKPFK